MEPRQGAEENVVYQPAEKMLCKLNPRSPDDIWSISYKGRVIARGEFSEIENVLAFIPKQPLPYRYLLARQVIVLCGVIAMLGLSYYAGTSMSRTLTPHLFQKIDSIEASAELCTTGVGEVGVSLNEIARRQDVLKLLLVGAFAELNNVKALAKEKSHPEERELSESGQVSERVARELAEQDIAELLDLERKKKELLLKDLEYKNKGFLSSFPERQSVIKSIETIDERIKEIKTKYGLLK